MRASSVGRVAVVAAVLAGGGALAAVTASGLQHRSPPGPAPQVVRQTTVPSPPRPVTAAPWPTRLVAHLGFVLAPPVLVGGELAVGVTGTPAQPPSPEHLVAVDLADGLVRTGEAVPPGSFVVGDGRRAWLVADGAAGSVVVRAVDLRRLTAAVGEPLPGVPSLPPSAAIAVGISGRGAGDLWVGDGGTLELVDPGSGTMLLRRVLTSGDIEGVVAEPDGRFVDVAVRTASSVGAAETLLVEAVAVASGRVVATRPLDLVAVSLAAVPGGVWAAGFDGVDGRLYRFGEPLTGAADGVGGPIGVTVAGTAVILSYAGGVRCAPLVGGLVLAEAPFPGGSTTGGLGRAWTPFGGAGGIVFALDGPPDEGVWSRILAVTPPAACGA